MEQWRRVNVFAELWRHALFRLSSSRKCDPPHPSSDKTQDSLIADRPTERRTLRLEASIHRRSIKLAHVITQGADPATPAIKSRRHKADSDHV